MQTDLANLFYAAQEQYLSEGQMTTFQEQIDILKQRLETYECLRDQEINIFQPIAEQLEKTFEQEHPKVLESALKHWISVLRYSSMATLLNNPEYLQHHLLEWLTDIIIAHQMQEMETYLYELLQLRLAEVLTVEQLALLHPFLELAKDTLLVQTHSSNSKAEAMI